MIHPHIRFTAFLLIFLSTIVLFSGCSKKAPDPVLNFPVLTTHNISNITQIKATSGGNITSDGGAGITARGVCWDTVTKPTTAGAHTSDGTGTGDYFSQLIDLSPNTTYHVRAYATNSVGTAYGNELVFTTLKIPADSVVDVDGHVYHVVVINSQKWLKENLKAAHYRNGDAIPEVKTDPQWKVLTTGAFCTYDNLAANGDVYGLLYNFYALTDARGLCPSGWHVPAETEWAALGNFLGGVSVAGGKMKSPGTIEKGTGLWYSPNSNADNSSGFSAIPGGYRINYGTFYSQGNVAYFWSSTDTASVNAWNYVLDANNGELKKIFNFTQNGFSVRCCKD